MSTETKVNGGSKLLTASVVMTLGVGGALLFRQSPTESRVPAAARSEAATNELLVRRSNGPPSSSFEGLAWPRAPESAIDSVPVAANSRTGSGGAAQFTGSIDPFRVEGAKAATQGRLTSEYGRPAAPSGGGYGAVVPTPPAPAPYGAPNAAVSSPAAQYAPSYLFVDPTSEAERTPLNNVSPPVELPAEYPAPRSTSNVPPVSPHSSNAIRSSSPYAGMSPVGSGGSLSPSPTASLQTPFLNAGTAHGGVASAPPRTVTPMLHADSGTTAQFEFAEPSRAEPLRAKRPDARRHKVRDGDTLASLAEAYYGDSARYTAIYEANRSELTNPDVLTIGTYLVIPSADEAAASTAAAAANPPPAARLLPRVQIRPLGE